MTKTKTFTNTNTLKNTFREHTFETFDQSDEETYPHQRQRPRQRLGMACELV